MIINHMANTKSEAQKLDLFRDEPAFDIKVDNKNSHFMVFHDHYTHEKHVIFLNIEYMSISNQLMTISLVSENFNPLHLYPSVIYDSAQDKFVYSDALLAIEEKGNEILSHFSMMKSCNASFISKKSMDDKDAYRMRLSLASSIKACSQICNSLYESKENLKSFQKSDDFENIKKVIKMNTELFERSFRELELKDNA